MNQSQCFHVAVLVLESHGVFFLKSQEHGKRLLKGSRQVRALGAIASACCEPCGSKGPTRLGFQNTQLARSGHFGERPPSLPVVPGFPPKKKAASPCRFAERVCPWFVSRQAGMFPSRRKIAARRRDLLRWLAESKAAILLALGQSPGVGPYLESNAVGHWKWIPSFPWQRGGGGGLGRSPDVWFSTFCRF